MTIISVATLVTVNVFQRVLNNLFLKHEKPLVDDVSIILMNDKVFIPIYLVQYMFLSFKLKRLLGGGGVVPG